MEVVLAAHGDGLLASDLRPKEPNRRVGVERSFLSSLPLLDRGDDVLPRRRTGPTKSPAFFGAVWMVQERHVSTGGVEHHGEPRNCEPHRLESVWSLVSGNPSTKSCSTQDVRIPQFPEHIRNGFV